MLYLDIFFIIIKSEVRSIIKEDKLKKVCIFLFLAISIFGFSKKTYNETKFRQKLIDWASSKVGAAYSLENRWGENTYDCSSFISRGLRETGMISVSGKKSDYGTTARGLYNNSGQKIGKNDYKSLKPGDIVHFSPVISTTTGHVGIVIRNLGMGRVEIIDARGTVFGVVRRVTNLSKNKRYLGATSAAQILRNNGYTPVNQNGIIIIPKKSHYLSPVQLAVIFIGGLIIFFIMVKIFRKQKRRKIKG